MTPELHVCRKCGYTTEVYGDETLDCPNGEPKGVGAIVMPGVHHFLEPLSHVPEEERDEYV